MVSRTRILTVILGLVSVLGAHGVSKALTFDLAADFSPTANPNGVWSYAVQDPDGSFGLLPVRFNSFGVDFWARPSPPPFGALPQIAHNPTATRVIFETAIVDPGAVTFHPGQFGDLAVVRFTAPLSGDYAVDAFFQDADTRANIATVSIAWNMSLLLSQNLGIGTVNFDEIVALAAGDTLDFRIAAGPNSYFNDNKRIGLTISTDGIVIPEPSAVLLVAIGLAAFALQSPGKSRR